MKLNFIGITHPTISTTLDRNRKLLRRHVASLRAMPDTAFADGFAGMVAAVEAGFRHEEVLLEVLGGTCPSPRLADHATLLCALHRVMPRVERGEVKLGRTVAEALDAVLMLPWQAALTPVRRRPTGAHARIPRWAPDGPAGNPAGRNTLG